MAPSTQPGPREGSCQSSCSVIWSVQMAPEYPQASYYSARYYDASAGRFLSEDPIGFDGGENGYAYADDSPNDFMDPSGLSPWGDLLNWYLNKYHPITPFPNQTAGQPCPLAPSDPCSTKGGTPYDPRPKHHHARDFHTPGLGSPIVAPGNGSVGNTYSGGAPIDPPYNLNQPPPSGSTNFVSFNSVDGYTITYFHVTQSVLSGSDQMVGTILGYTDDTGRQLPRPGMHTHVQVNDPWGRPIDPLKYFRNCN
jgi:RHS repeat-associated protein